MESRKQSPSLGVVITSYNRPEYLRTAMKSVAAQSLPPNEIVVVDDCSDFDVHEALRDFADLPLKIVTKQVRQGASHSRNLGVAHCVSDYIAFLDDDDAFLPNRLEHAKQIFAQNNECQACLCSYFVIDGGARKKVPLSGWVVEDMLKNGNPYCGTSGLIINRSLALQQGFDEEVPSGEDWELFARLSQQGTLYFTSAPLFLYRAGSHASKTNEKKYLTINQLEKRFVAAYKQRMWMGEKNFKKRIANQILGDLGNKQQGWKWIMFAIEKVGYLVTAQVLYLLTARKIARMFVQ